MATTVVVGGIKPDLPILGDTQQFIFNKPVAQTQCVNTTTATSVVSPQINLDFLNASTRGFRLNQSTTTTVPGGIFSLNSVQYQVSSYASTPLFTFNEGGLDSFAFKKTVKFEQACQSIAPTSGADVANKTYVDGKTLNSFAVPTGDVSLNNKKITQLAPPTASTDATTKEYVDGKTWSRSQISDLNTASLSMFASPASDLYMNGKKIIGLAYPEVSNDAVTKGHLEKLGVCVCALATTVHLDMFIYSNGPDNNGVGATLKSTTGGIPLIDNNSGPSSFVLVKNQSSPSQNGIYRATSWTPGNYTLTRHDSFDRYAPGTRYGLILVLFGNVNAKTLWVQNGPYDTVGIGPITFTMIGAPLPSSEEKVDYLDKKLVKRHRGD